MWNSSSESRSLDKLDTPIYEEGPALTRPFKRCHVRPSSSIVSTLPQAMAASGSKIEDAILVGIYCKSLLIVSHILSK
jgi:hypothetical protein